MIKSQCDLLSEGSVGCNRISVSQTCIMSPKSEVIVYVEVNILEKDSPSVLYMHFNVMTYIHCRRFMNNLSGAYWLFTLDLCSGYWQVQLELYDNA